jgi:hypothetical protein
MPDEMAIFAKVFSAANTVIRPLLRSPLHTVLSGRLMLLEYTGPKTGNRYSLPVGYFRWDDGDVLVFSSANWPRTLDRALDVRVLVKGRWFTAAATVIRPVERRADVLAEFAKRYGAKAAGRAMRNVPTDREPTRDELLDAANRTSLVRLALTTENATSS